MIIVLRYGGSEIRVMLVEVIIKKILVLKVVIPVACRYGEPLCDDVGAQYYLLIVFLMSGGWGRAMVFSYQSIPLGACT